MGKGSTPRDRTLPTTNWPLVERAGREGRAVALEQLLERYLSPLRTHLVFERHLDPHRADDMLQSFVSDQVLQRDLIARADRKRGKFRTFLLTALDNYVISRLRRENADKRAPERAALVDMREHPEMVRTECGPAEKFEVAWAREVLAEAVRRMRADCEKRDRVEIWRLFEQRVVGPSLGDMDPVPYEELVERLGFKSPSQAYNALVTAKRTFVRSLESVVGEYVADGEGVEAEIRELRAILSRAAARSADALRI